MALATYALTDYATIAASLRLSGGLDQTLIERFIAVASSAIERVTNRRLTYAPGLVELYATYGSNKLLVERSPILALGAASDPNGPVDTNDIRIDDIAAGVLWRDSGWAWSASLRPGVSLLTLDRQAGTEQKLASITYAGGYITGPQAYSAAAWPGSTTAIPVGTLLIPASQPLQLWQAMATTLNVGLVTGAVEPTWGASPIAGYTTKTDGTITWIYLGTSGAAGARGSAVTLPDDLEQAVVVTAVAAYRTSKRDPSIKSESMLGVSYTYGDKAHGLPDQAYTTALAYARTV